MSFLEEVFSETRDRELEGRAEELAEMRRIVAALTQRIPQLEAPGEPRDGPETPSPRSDRGARVGKMPRRP